MLIRKDPSKEKVLYSAAQSLIVPSMFGLKSIVVWCKPTKRLKLGGILRNGHVSLLKLHEFDHLAVPHIHRKVPIQELPLKHGPSQRQSSRSKS
ncbi:hypothetical protein QL285_010250 [Trifolium repens]|nr:hypothetical protein QL285_010250 [Trifolium repens]